MMTLSLYAPDSLELRKYKQQPNLLQYDLVTRKGKTGELHTDFAVKKPTLYFKEGSVFPVLDQASYGQVTTAKFENPDYEPAHTIYQNGKGFMVRLISQT